VRPLFQGHDCGHLDLDDHSGPGELANCQQRVRRQGMASERFDAALAVIGLVTSVPRLFDDGE
jgi:hypothetical protein